MKKKPNTPRQATGTKAEPNDLAALIIEVRRLIQSARRGVASVVDTFQVMTNFEIGRRIVEHEQKGAKRAKYGAELLHELSASLTEEFGRGFSVTNLKLMRQFFTENQFRIGQSVTDQFGMLAPISQSPTDQSTIFQSVTEKSESFPFLLSWTHYVELLGLRSQRNANIYPRIPSGCRRLVAGKPPNSHVLISKRQLIDLLIE